MLGYNWHIDQVFLGEEFLAAPIHSVLAHTDICRRSKMTFKLKGRVVFIWRGVAGGSRGPRRRRGAGRRGHLGLGHVRGALPQPQPLPAASARRGYQGGWEHQGPSLNLQALPVPVYYH